jgi:Ca2+-binding RTX toxin-like protein
MSDYYAPRGAQALANSITAGAQTLPRAAKLNFGTYVVVWEDRSGSVDDPTTAIRGQRFANGGGKAGAEFLVNTVTAGEQTDPSVAATIDGGFVVAWTGTDASGTGIKAQRYTSAGVKSGGEFLVNTITTDAQTEARVTAAGSLFAVVWLDYSGSGTAIRGQYYLSSGAKYGNEFLVSSNASEVHSGLSVASPADGNSRIVVTWTQANGDGSGSAVMAQVVMADGARLGSAVRVSQSTAGNQLDAAVAVHQPSQGFVVAYVDDGGTFGAAGAIKVRIFSPDGVATGSDMLITGQGESGSDPSVIAYPSGVLAVSWRDASGSTRVQLVNGSGEMLGDDFAASSTGAAGELATLLPLDTESFLVTWADGDVQTRTFDPAGPAVVDIVISDTRLSEAPPENLPVAALRATGIAGSSGFTFSILSDSTGGGFRLDGDRLVVDDASLIDFETAAQAQVTVRATDSQGRIRDETFNLTVTDATIEPGDWSAGALFSPNDAAYGPTIPDIAPLASGGFVMVYFDSRFSSSGSGGSPVRGQIFSASGERTGGEFQVAISQDGNQHPVSVAALADGGFVVLFSDYREGHGNTGAQLRAQVFDAEGQAVSAQVKVATTSAGGQSGTVTGLPSGGFVVTFANGWAGVVPTTTSDVKAQIFDSAGNKVGGEFQVPSTFSWPQSDPDVATLADGGFVIVWDNGNASISGQRFDAAGGRVGNSFPVNSSANLHYNPSVTGLAGGGFAVTWQQGTGYGNDNPDPWSVKAQLFDAAGARVGGEFLVHTDPAGDQRQPIVTPLADGGFLIAWNDQAIGPGLDVFGGVTKAQMFNALGGKVGGEFALNEGFGQEHFYTAAAMLGWGGFVIGFGDSGGNTPGASQSVQARLFSPLGFDARDDAVIASEAAALAGSVFADNGSGADAAPAAGNLMVSEVNGSAANVGRTITLASGALLTLNADGTFSYDPNHVFDALAAYDSGGSNVTAGDSFSYRLGGGDSATVTVTVRGAYSTPHIVQGTPGADMLTGSNLADIFVGGLGNDTYFVDVSNDEVQEAAGEGIDTVRTALFNYTLQANVENVVGTFAGTGPAQTLSGNLLHNHITGSEANDVLIARAGDDLLVGRGGIDILEGGPGRDVMIGGYVSAANLIAAGGFADAAGGENKVYRDVNGLAAGSTLLLSFTAALPAPAGAPVFLDIIWNGTVVGAVPLSTTLTQYSFLVIAAVAGTGTDGANRLELRSTGTDGVAALLDAAALSAILPDGGANWANYDSEFDGGPGAVLVNLSDHDAMLDGVLVPAGQARDTNGVFDMLAAIDSVAVADAGSNWVLGSTGDNHFQGGNGNDVFDGGGGADFMVGNLGNDTYIVDSLDDWVYEAPDGGSDEIRTALASYALSNLSAVENLTGTSGLGQALTGNDLANIVTGGAGNDVIDGGSGNDSLRLQDGGVDDALGGAGDDIIYYGATLTAADDNDGGDGTRDVLILQGDYDLTFAARSLVNIEFLSLQSGSRTTFGDTAGNRYDYDLSTIDSNVAAGQLLTVNGQSLLAGEDLSFDGSAEMDGKFLVYAGHGTDTLKGGAGNDTFFFEGPRLNAGDTVDGGAGRDAVIVTGGSGLNHIEFGETNFLSIESISVNARYASDRAAVPSYELVLKNGNVTAGGSLIVNGSSLSAGQTFSVDGSRVADGALNLFGGGADDVFIGGAKADTIFAAGGADTSTGGGGADIFQYRSASDSAVADADRILDFEVGVDKIDLHFIDADAGIAGDQAFSFIGGGAFTNSAGQLRATFDSGNNVWSVEGDTNGDGAADFLILVTATTAAPLTGTDFIL